MIAISREKIVFKYLFVVVFPSAIYVKPANIISHIQIVTHSVRIHVLIIEQYS